MIIGVGIDLVSVARIKNLSSRFEKKFAEKIFSKKEIFELAQGYYMKVNITPHKLADIIKEMAGEIPVHSE